MLNWAEKEQKRAKKDSCSAVYALFLYQSYLVMIVSYKPAFGLAPEVKLSKEPTQRNVRMRVMSSSFAK
jgi:hypothetical protein